VGDSVFGKAEVYRPQTGQDALPFLAKPNSNIPVTLDEIEER
jgi:hypothetical protein